MDQLPSGILFVAISQKKYKSLLPYRVVDAFRQLYSSTKSKRLPIEVMAQVPNFNTGLLHLIKVAKDRRKLDEKIQKLRDDYEALQSRQKEEYQNFHEAAEELRRAGFANEPWFIEMCNQRIAFKWRMASENKKLADTIQRLITNQQTRGQS
ncbi:hypothetical protein CI238_12063 [Colletotrichum incanum]|uniref:Uncharacterized protein n=1 Tax=Colletotrichum incanum TaxID=1573173 RepID=A0A161Y1Q9_COLIC|nr:hypothetical protein CI238_12063 [Colletotrichum incanum]